MKIFNFPKNVARENYFANLLRADKQTKKNSVAKTYFVLASRIADESSEAK